MILWRIFRAGKNTKKVLEISGQVIFCIRKVLDGGYDPVRFIKPYGHSSGF